jgi:hypothetical protein
MEFVPASVQMLLMCVCVCVDYTEQGPLAHWLVRDGFWSSRPADRSSKWKPSNLYEFTAEPRIHERSDLGYNAI